MAVFDETKMRLNILRDSIVDHEVRSIDAILILIDIVECYLVLLNEEVKNGS